MIYLPRKLMIGISLANAADDERFGFLIRHGDQVRSSLQFNPLLAAHVMLQHIAAGPSEFDSEIQVFHYLSCALEAVSAAIRSINFT